MRIYSSVSTMSKKLHVDYVCCYCGKENSDDSQSLEIEAQSHGSIVPSEKLREESRDLAVEKMTTQLEHLSKGDLRTAHLTCTCSSCSKRQPWASYMKVPTWTIVLAGLFVVMLLYLAAHWEEVIIGPRLAILLVMPLPLIIIAIHNLITDRKVARLSSEYLPHITLK